MNKAILATLALLALPLGAARAQDMAASPACTGAAPALPAELAGWATRAPLRAAATPARAAAATLTVGKGIDATLLPTSALTYAIRPEKPGGSVSFGGLFGFTIGQAGTYRIALGSGAWIDVLRGKTPVTSSAHGHGPDCSTVRKMVDFPLVPGRYTLQVAANGAADLPILLTRLP